MRTDGVFTFASLINHGALSDSQRDVISGSTGSVGCDCNCDPCDCNEGDCNCNCNG